MSEADWRERESLFRDRVGAGRVLAGALSRYSGRDVLVLGIPRGGVPVAAEVARALGGELDVLVARKLGAPGWEELALGAVTADGGRVLNDALIRDLEVKAEYLDAVTAKQVGDALAAEKRFRGSRPVPTVAGRVVIIVDDGLATGATMRAAVRSVRQRMPARVIVAAPVGTVEACSELRGEADEVACPHVPERFGAVGAFYEVFTPTSDAEVEAILEAFHAVRTTSP